MPQSLKVGPHVYSVVRRSISGQLGECDFNALQISVKNRLRRSKGKEILVHELLHACTHPSMNCGQKYTDEDFVTAVSPVLLQVLQDNPDLLRYLTE